ncbi:hypothetical protein [Micromonospora sp. NPDC004704]
MTRHLATYDWGMTAGLNSEAGVYLALLAILAVALIGALYVIGHLNRLLDDQATEHTAVAEQLQCQAAVITEQRGQLTRQQVEIRRLTAQAALTPDADPLDDLYDVPAVADNARNTRRTR